MGMVGGYDAHYYCDCCNDFCEVNGIGVETYQDAIHLMKKDEDKKQSWLLRDDGVVLCEKCKAQNNPEIMNEDDREGYVWTLKKEGVASESFVLVPKEPTEKILSKAIHKYLKVNDLSIVTNRMYHVYKAMIEAAEGK